MGVIDTKVFKTGNSVAVRLPKALGFHEGMDVQIEQVGDGIRIRPTFDPVEEKRKLNEFVAAMLALGPIGDIERVRPTEILDREGL